MQQLLEFNFRVSMLLKDELQNYSNKSSGLNGPTISNEPTGSNGPAISNERTGLNNPPGSNANHIKWLKRFNF